MTAEGTLFSWYTLDDMAHSMHWAKRLLRELPEDPASVLRRSRTYADATFLPLFFNHLAGLIFDDPQGALKWASIAPALAQEVPRGGGTEARREHRDRLVKAWALAADGQRACGHHEESDRAFAEALALMDSGAVSPAVRSEISLCRAYLRACQKRLEEALELSVQAEREVRAETEKEAHTLAKACRGYVLNELRRFPEAIEVLGEILSSIDPRESPTFERLHLAAMTNLAYAITSSSRRADQTAALRYVRRARELVKGGRRFVPRYRLLWVEGLVWAALGYHARAETALKIAHEGFETLRMPYETALLSLDLGALYAVHEEWDKLAPLAVKTFQQFHVLAADTQAIAALSLWADAVKARRLTDEITSAARSQIESRIGPGGCCKKRKRSTV